MTLLSLENFWCDIVWSTTNGSLSLSIELKLGCQTKITDLDLHLVIKEQITQLEISMNDSVGVQILNGITNLNNIALNLEFMQSSSPPQKFIQGLTLAEFQDNVDIFSILEEMLEPHNVRMMERSMDLDLTHQLLLRS